MQVMTTTLPTTQKAIKKRTLTKSGAIQAQRCLSIATNLSFIAIHGHLDQAVDPVALELCQIDHHRTTTIGDLLHQDG